LAIIPVIIINWKGFDDTIESVESVLNQSYKDIVVHIADNNSGEEEFKRLSAVFGGNQRIVLHKNEENLGFTIAHNVLFEKLLKEDYEYIALLNNDAVADKNWIENILQSAKKEDADIVACKMLNYYDRKIIDSLGLYLLSSGEILPAGNGESAETYKNSQSIIGASGGACLFKAEMLKETGIFDSYFSTGYEDAELGLRAFINGKKIILCEDAIVFHKISKSVTKVCDEKKIQKIYEDKNYTYLKLMPGGILLYNLTPNLLRFILIIFIHLVTLRFRFSKNYLIAHYHTLFRDRNRIIKARNEMRGKRKVTSSAIIKNQRFVFYYDLKRFYEFIIKGKKNKLERY
jgi:GT2 family glycosyltransferase